MPEIKPDTKIASDAIALIGIDWGSSHVRVFGLGADGTILQRAHHALGLKAMKDHDFGETLAAMIAPLKATNAPIIISGMAGARGGWVEVPYAQAPITLSALAAHQIELTADQKGERLSRHRVFIAGGLCLRVNLKDGARFDVMRGEETQILGYLSQLATGLETLILPGTHSKWAKVSSNRVRDFSTFFTGDLYASLKDHPILVGSTPQIDDDGAFLCGVEASIDPHLLTSLFTVRTTVLKGDLEPSMTRSYLSGLLIGTELRQGAALGYGGPYALLGSDALNALYTKAILTLGWDAPWVGDTDALTAAGLFARFLSIQG